jgi:hypothetical protein
VGAQKYFANPDFRIYYFAKEVGMPKITADIPEDLYRFVRSKILDQRLEGEHTTVSSLVADLLYKWKNGGLARRRRSGAYASSPIKEDVLVTPEQETLEQQIDKILEKEGLSDEERGPIVEVLAPHIRQLVRMAKLMGGIPT